MSSVVAKALLTNLPNLQGRFIGIGQRDYSFATMLAMRGMQRNSNPFTEVPAMEFNMSVVSSLDNASQPALTENDTNSAPTSTVYPKTQNTNACNQFREAVDFSDIKLSDGFLSGNTVVAEQALIDDVNSQINDHLEQVKRDIDFSFINGVYSSGKSDSDTAWQTRGIYTAITTNKINASSTPISKDLIEKQLLVSMKDNGANMRDVVFFCNGITLVEINRLYGVQPRDTSTGGINITRLVLPLAGGADLIYNDNVPTGVLLAVDMSFCRGVSNTRPGYSQIDFRQLNTNGESEMWRIFAKLGIDYGHESKHGAIYGLVAAS